MSADNFLAIVKKGRKYYGYNCSASSIYRDPKDFEDGLPCFIASSLKEAIMKAQQETTEYGFHFVNLV